MTHVRARQLAGLALLLICGLVRAADERPLAPVEASQPAKKKVWKAKTPVVKQLAQKVIALPADIAGLFIGNRWSEGLSHTAFIGPRITTKFVDAQGWDIPSDKLLPVSLSGQPDMVELNLSETRVAVWLREDLNLHCDLEQDPAIARGDQFAVKVALQFRFR